MTKQYASVYREYTYQFIQGIQKHPAKKCAISLISYIIALYYYFIPFYFIFASGVNKIS